MFSTLINLLYVHNFPGKFSMACTLLTPSLLQVSMTLPDDFILSMGNPLGVNRKLFFSHRLSPEMERQTEKMEEMGEERHSYRSKDNKEKKKRRHHSPDKHRHKSKKKHKHHHEHKKKKRRSKCSNSSSSDSNND